MPPSPPVAEPARSLAWVSVAALTCGVPGLVRPELVDLELLLLTDRKMTSGSSSISASLMPPLPPRALSPPSWHELRSGPTPGPGITATDS